MLIQILTGIPDGLGDLLLSVGLPVLCGWLLFRIRAFGAGDIKLFCVIGILNGCRMLAAAAVCSLGIAACYGLFCLIRHGQLARALTDLLSYGAELLRDRRLRPYPQAGEADRQIHFCAAALAGYVLALVLSVE